MDLQVEERVTAQRLAVPSTKPAASSAPSSAQRKLADRPAAAPPVTDHAIWAVTQRGIGLLALLLVVPVLAVLYVLIKTTSRGPFLFAQTRRGFGGKPFVIYKIRSLRVQSEDDTRFGVGRNAADVTAVGRLLRKLKLDELPQLWNVATGSMNLVGPRPIPIALEDELTRHLPNFSQRHRTKPGLTSFGQITVVENRLGPDLVRDWNERLEAELHYIRNKCFAYDVIVIVLTGLYLLRALVPSRQRANPTLATATTDKHAKQTPAAQTQVLGTAIANLDYAQVVELVSSWVRQQQPQYVAICPVHSVVTAVLDPSHREALLHAGLNTADGVPIVWAQRLLGHVSASRVYGPTLMLHLLARAQRDGLRVGFYGGTDACLSQLQTNLLQQFPRLTIACAISPPFRALTTDEDEQLVQQIRAAAPQLLFVGLGCPKQERWMFEHRDRLPTVQLGVGAAFSFHAGQLRQAPAALQRLGLEWLFRLCCEPRRLFKRYATTNPIYVVLLAKQVLCRWLLRRDYQRTVPAITPHKPT